MAGEENQIKHVILLMLENHSFDQTLGCFNEKYPELNGVSESNFNVDSKGVHFYQKPYFYQQMEIDPNHEVENVKEQISGSNKGFVTNLEKVAGSTDDHKRKIMAYYKRGELPALHALAEHYTICDRWHSSIPGPTWPNRFFALSGTTLGYVDMPEGGKNFEMVFNQCQPTLFDRLEEKNVRWNVFFYDVPSSLVLVNQRKVANIEKYQEIDVFFDACDSYKDEKDFPQFAFVEPKYYGQDQNDDHPPHNVMKAQKLIADVYNAIRGNKKLFENSLLIVTYDEHGGFYDHVEPPKAVAPDGNRQQYSFDQYGVRVPTILVSPWVKESLDKTLYDHSSVLKYLTEKWDLGPLGARTADSATNSIRSAIQPVMRNVDDLPGFIRVPYKLLVPPDPSLEENTLSTHHDGLAMVFSGFKDDLFLSAGVEEWKEFALEWQKSGGMFWKYVKSWKFILGTSLMAAGRAFQAKAKEEIRQKQSEVVSPASVQRLLEKARVAESDKKL